MEEPLKSLLGQQQHDETQQQLSARPSQHEKKPSLEETMQQRTASTQFFMTSTETNFKNQDASIHNLEVQVGQIANLFASKPHDHCQAI